MKDDCIFCKLANGVFATNSVYEDEDFNVILDVGPATKGHLLILPKEHYDNLYELPEELCGKAMKLAKKMAVHLRDRLKCDGLNIVQNNGEAAGQTVMHYHLHVIPRYKDDGQNMLWNPTEPGNEKLEELCDEIKEGL